MPRITSGLGWFDTATLSYESMTTRTVPFDRDTDAIETVVVPINREDTFLRYEVSRPESNLPTNTSENRGSEADPPVPLPQLCG